MKYFMMEIWRLRKSKILFTALIIELLTIMIAYLSGLVKNFSTAEFYQSGILGISITVRYLYSSLIIASVFSRDIERGFFASYIAAGVKRSTIWISKIFASFLIIVISFGFFGVVNRVLALQNDPLFNAHKLYWLTIGLALIPLFAHILVISLIDVFFSNTLFTSITTTFFIIASGLLPTSISKWLYITYNNPMLFVVYGDERQNILMVVIIAVTIILTGIFSLFYINSIDI